MCTDKLPHLSDVDELDDDVWSLLWCSLTQHHALNPLRQSVEERDRTLQSRIVPQHSLRGVVLEIAELWSTKYWHLIRSQLSLRAASKKLWRHHYEWLSDVRWFGGRLWIRGRWVVVRECQLWCCRRRERSSWRDAACSVGVPTGCEATRTKACNTRRKRT